MDHETHSFFNSAGSLQDILLSNLNDGHALLGIFSGLRMLHFSGRLECTYLVTIGTWSFLSSNGMFIGLERLMKHEVST